MFWAVSDVSSSDLLEFGQRIQQAVTSTTMEPQTST